MNQYAILVDAGYLLACAGKLVYGTDKRSEFRVDTPALISALMKVADTRLPGDLLRVYWFDAAKDRVPTVEQRAVAVQPNVKLRLGNLNASGQQKGVDAKVRADLEALARNHAITDAILIAGDEDMLPAVEAAQAYGVRVHLWGVEAPYGHNQALQLVWEADDYHQLDEDFCRPYLSQTCKAPVVIPMPVTPVPLARPFPGHLPVPGPPPRIPAPIPDFLRRVEEVGEMVAHRWLTERGRDNLAELLPEAPRLPVVIDKELLVAAEGELGRGLRNTEEARRRLRDGFWARLHREFDSGKDST